MQILRITVKNLNSLRLTRTIDFTCPPLSHAGIFAITGDTGAGKSTLLDAITLALYGQVPRREKEDLGATMSYGATDCLAEVEFAHAGSTYRAKWSLRRAHGRATGNILGPSRELAKQNPETGAFDIIGQAEREVSNQILELTGLDFGRFRKSVLLAQGEFAAFLDANASVRGELLERITGTEIYSAISRAAHVRNREETNRLNELTWELNQLNILDEEALHQLQTQIQTLTEDANTARQRKTTLQKQLDLKQSFDTLSGEIQQLEAQKSEIDLQKAERAEAFQRLLRHEESAHLHGDLHAMDQRGEINAGTEKEIASTRQTLLQVLPQIEEKEQQQQQQRALRDAQQATLEQLRPVWEKTRALDAALSAKAQEEKEKQRKVASAQESLQAFEAQIAACQSELAALAVQIAEEDAWKAANSRLEGLPMAVAGISAQLDHHDKLLEQLRQTRQEAKRTEEQLHHTKAEQSKLQAERDAAQETLHQTQHAMHELLPPWLSTQEQPIKTTLLKALNVIVEKKNLLKEIQDNFETYQSLLKERNDWEAQVSSLLARDLAISKELFNALDELEACQEILDYTKNNYENHLKIANFEQYRAELKDGDPCPLCQSTHHPFRLHDFHPQPDRAQKEYRKAEARYKEAARRAQQLSLDHRTTGDQIEWSYTRDTSLSNLQKKEGELAALLGKAHALHLKVENSGALHSALQQLEADGNALTAADASAAKISGLEEALRKLEQEYGQKTGETERLYGKLAMLQSQGEEQQKSTDLTYQNLLNTIASFFPQWAAELPQNLKQQLGQSTEEVRRRQQRRTDLAQNREVHLTRKKYLSEQLHKEQTQLAGLQAELQNTRESLDTLRSERNTLLGERNPDTEQQQATTALRELEAAENECSRDLNTLLQQKHQADATLKTREDILEEGRRAWTQSAQALEAACIAQGIASIAELRSLQMEASEVKALQHLRGELGKREIETNTRLLTTQNARTAIAREAETLPDRETLLRDVQAAEAGEKQLFQQLGACMEKLDSDQKQRKQEEGLRKVHEQQKKEVARWTALDQLIGSNDGKKFRTYAQGLTLHMLVQRANRHLAKLSDRYQISKKESKDMELELEIQDAYHANCRRGMKTLSGGERFLVSLALALGLSEMAGRDTQIQSLFIDEGFGSLDENTLDTALYALESLQASGKTIGVISHVKELKERIGVKIQIQKRGNGFSDIELVER